jgi:hypothetical protein
MGVVEMVVEMGTMKILKRSLFDESRPRLWLRVG